MKDAFEMMSQQEHDDYTRELENKLEFLTNTLMNYNTMTSEDIDTLLLTVTSTSLTLKEGEEDERR